MAKRVIPCHIVIGIFFIQLAQCFECIAGNDECIGGGTPDMGLYPVHRFSMAFAFVVAMVMIIEDEIDPFRCVKHLDMRSVVHKLIHPYPFKPDVSDAEVGLTVS